MNLRFDHPAWLLLGLVAVPLVLVGLRSLRPMDGLRRTVVLSLRLLLLGAMAVALAGPHTVREHHRLTVIGLLDVSGSVRRFAHLPALGESARRSNIEYLRQWFRQATQTRLPDDRFGLVVFDGKAIAIWAPTAGDYVDDNLDVTMHEGTNIAEAIQLGLAMFPPDTARRLILVTDGNETIGDALEAVRQAAAGLSGDGDPLTAAHSGVPIDVVPIAYQVSGDVQIARVEAPPHAQPGQVVTVRIMLEATAPTPGRLTLRREGVAIDLDEDRPGTSAHLVVPAGRSVHLVQVVLGETPVNRFEAIFEPDHPEDDALPDNNRAEAFTSTPSKGLVLVLDGRAEPHANLLAQTLQQAGIPTRSEPPHRLPDDLLSLQSFDLIVLDNVSAVQLSRSQHDLLARYVNDLGGGLIMVGGENSFGAGGWNGTALEAILPVELDPPKELRLPTAALVLVLDKSGSMNASVAGARTTQQEIANEGAALAIESLRSDSLIGVVAFDTFAYVWVPLQRNDDPTRIADRVRGITAGGGTNLEPALRRAHEMLKDAKVAKKRVVCLTDGRSPTRNLEKIVERMAADNIKLTTIAIGDDADRETLEKLAEIGGGAFYPVRNPRILPDVLVDSVQVINKPLLKEVPFVPVVQPTGSPLAAGMQAAPILDGLVITAARNDPKVFVDMTHPDGEPLLAHWQVGLGRVAVFTSDADGGWSKRWIDWPGYGTFWTQLARTIARPPMSRDAELITEIKDDRLWVTLEATREDEGFLDYLQVDGTVYDPDGGARPLRLRQVAPGRYEAVVPAPAAGNYIVALNPHRGTRRLAPVIGGANRATSSEFRRYRSNLAKLEQIIQIGGGRRLDITDPAGASLFDRTGLQVSVSVLPAWRTVLWWTLLLVLLDAAARRIAWSYARLRAVAARALARVSSASGRGRQAAATLTSLRRVSDEVDQRLGDRAAAEPGPASPEPLPPQASPSLPAAPPEPPEPSKVTAALDALLGRTKPEHQPEAPPEPEATTRPASETTSSLLAAKRRTQKRLQGEQESDA